ncbi:MAG: AraC family transcriptional regulator [Spirochaetes bacterium]|nr:AraC family transcriptional regulator [Spirochaetota bacterium]
MSTLILIGIDITFFGFGLCLLRALDLLVSEGRRSAYGIFFYFFNGILMLGFGLTARGVPPVHPESIFLFVASLLMVGPLDFFYYHTLLYPERRLPYRAWIHFVPAAVVLAGEVVFQLQPAYLKRDLIAGFFREPFGHILFILLAAISLHVLAYAIIIIRTVFADVTGSVSSRGFRFVLYSGVTIILIIALVLGGFMSGSPGVFVAGCVLNVSLHVAIYLGTRANPVFFTTLKRAIRKKRYEKSMLEGLDTGIIGERLNELMRDEELFRDSEVSLPSVAKKLALTPHQLSQLLNERMGTNFHDFVNRFRVEAAKKLLVDNPEANIISVCFNVGFNSKSSFNAAFKKLTGMTPRDYKSGIGKL